MLSSIASRLCFHTLCGLLLMICYPFQLLFSGNQNVYFLWGMAKVQVGSLAIDPLLAQTDPFPLFSLVIFGVFKFLHPYFFYALYWFVNSIYSFALFGIANHLYNIYSKKNELALFTAFFLLLHSGAIWAGMFRVMFGVDLSSVWDSGIAEQGVLRGYLQPSTAGVFLVLSVYFFLKNVPSATFTTLSVAAIFHANYIILGAGVGVIYLILFYSEKKIRKTNIILWSIFSVLIVLPQLWYINQYFLPSSDVETESMRQAVLQTQNGNMHLSPALWLNLRTLLQFLTISAALWFYRHERIGKLLLLLVILFGGLSAATFISGSSTLLSLTPWRISIVLMPISSILLIGNLVVSKENFVLKNFIRPTLLVTGLILLLSFAIYRVFGTQDPDFIFLWRFATLSCVVASILAIFLYKNFFKKSWVLSVVMALTILSTITSGILEIKMEHSFRWHNPASGVINYLHAHSRPTTLVLAPLEFTTLRINAGVAVVADNNLVHGLYLPQLLKHQDTINHFYQKNYSNEQIITLQQKLGFNTIVAPIKKEIPTNLPFKEVYRDDNYKILTFN